MVHPSDDAAAALAASTPHRAQPHSAGAVLALSGRGDALRRWRAQLGPSDPRVAAVSEPASLHALYGAAARHISCSYDLRGASREVQMLFPSASAPAAADDSTSLGGTAAALPETNSAPAGSGQHAQQLRAEGFEEGVPAPLSVPRLQQQWLALPAAGAAQQLAALRALHHLTWAGYALRGMLLCSAAPLLPPAPAPATCNGNGNGNGYCANGGGGSLHKAAGAAAAAAAASAACGGPVLVMEVAKEEAADQLPRALQGLPSAGGAAAAAHHHAHVHAHGHAHANGNGSSNGNGIGCAAHDGRGQQRTPSSLLPSDVLRSMLLPSDMHGLPQVRLGVHPPMQC